MKKMKKYFIIIFSAVIAFLFQSCEKVTEGISRITYYPVMEMQGETFMTLAQGVTFTDPGVTSEVNGTPSTVVVAGDVVDVNTPGVYTITYTSTNTDGFSVSLSRFVGIIAPTAAPNDLSGIYVRNTNTAKFTWIKVAMGLYICNNVGGVAGNPPYIFDVYVFNTDGFNVIVPTQPSGIAGNLYCTPVASGSAPGKVVYKPGALGTLAYKWAVMGAGFGTTIRTFNHSN
jgi:hypothetical protein